MRTLKFFISGQISGLDYLEAKRNFATAQEELQKIGCVKVYNPMEKIDPDLQWKQQMEICLEEIAHSDVVVFQSNWKESVGARWEFQEANRLGKIIRTFSASDMMDIKRNLV